MKDVDGGEGTCVCTAEEDCRGRSWCAAGGGGIDGVRASALAAVLRKQVIIVCWQPGGCEGKLSSDKLTQIVRKEGWPASFRHAGTGCLPPCDVRSRPLMWANCGKTLKSKALEESGITYQSLFVAEIERVNCGLASWYALIAASGSWEDAAGAARAERRGGLLFIRGREKPSAQCPPCVRALLLLWLEYMSATTVGYCQSMNFLAAILILQAVLKDYLCSEMPAVCKKFEVPAGLEGARVALTSATGARMRPLVCVHQLVKERAGGDAGS
eukprot:767227-Hanusia_phi.AAC.1